MMQYDPCMRTTLTIGEANDQRLRRIAREQNRRYKDVVNDAIALGLAQLEVHETNPKYYVEPVNAVIMPTIDRTKLNSLLDETESDQW